MNKVSVLVAGISLLGTGTFANALEGIAPVQKSPPPAKTTPVKPAPVAPKQPATKQYPTAAPSRDAIKDLRQVGPVDLVVSDLFIASDEVRFKVRNAGLSEKKPGQVRYQLTVTQFAISPPDAVVSTRTYNGVAALTSLSRLKPYQETGEDRVTGQRVGMSDSMRLVMCINPDQAVSEGNYNNNCLTRYSNQVLPDLAIVSGSFNLYKPPKEDSWYKKVGDFLWDVVTGFEFDPSGIAPQDHVKLTIQNKGGVAVTGFDVKVGVWRPGQSGKTYQRTYTQSLAPGEKRVIGVYVHQDNKRWTDNSCCGATAMVDSTQKIRESNEGNNKMSLSTARVRDHR